MSEGGSEVNPTLTPQMGMQEPVLNDTSMTGNLTTSRSVLEKALRPPGDPTSSSLVDGLSPSCSNSATNVAHILHEPVHAIGASDNHSLSSFNNAACCFF